MATNPFKRAEKTKARLRLALFGVSGSGKTMSALAIAQAFGKVAVIDTEHGSASKYASLFSFDVLELTNYHPQQYIEAIKAAGEAGYDALVIDSLTHAWSGVGGVLEIVDRLAAKSDSRNSYAAWRGATPLHNQLVETILASNCHVIATMRSKTEYVLEKDDRGKTAPRKVGMAPVQRDGMEYEFDVVGELDNENTLFISKSRIPELNGQMIQRPTIALGQQMVAWLADGVDAPLKPAAPSVEPAPASVRGAGIPAASKSVQPPQQENADMRQRPDESEIAPNLYHCDRLIVTKGRDGKAFKVTVVKSGTAIPLSAQHVAELDLNGVALAELEPTIYTLEPSWSLYADRDNDGTWIIEKIDTRIPVTA